MMRLSTMWKVDSTIKADGSSPVAECILEKWARDVGSGRFFRSSANFLYIFQSESKHHFLRFADDSERSREVIEAEVELLGWLAGAGIDVAVPVPSGRGNSVETVETRWGTFHAVVFPVLEGEQLEIGDLDKSGFQRWGAALGGLHAALEGYPGAGSMARPTWRNHLEPARECVPKDAPALRDELKEIASALAALPEPRDTYGLIHFDFELDNLIFRDGSVGILDFDDCSRLWYAADIAFALGDLFAEGADMGDDRFRAFVAGYVAHHPLDNESLSHIPLFLRLADLLDYARLVRAADLAVGPDYPEWLGALDRKLSDRMRAYRTFIETSEA